MDRTSKQEMYLWYVHITFIPVRTVTHTRRRELTDCCGNGVSELEFFTSQSLPQERYLVCQGLHPRGFVCAEGRVMRKGREQVDQLLQQRNYAAEAVLLFL